MSMNALKHAQEMGNSNFHYNSIDRVLVKYQPGMTRYKKKKRKHSWNMQNNVKNKCYGNATFTDKPGGNIVIGSVLEGCIVRALTRSVMIFVVQQPCELIRRIRILHFEMFYLEMHWDEMHWDRVLCAERHHCRYIYY